jgi:isoleucyl-tRNA synthetase
MTKKTHYPEATSNPDFPQIEKRILHFWKNNHTFQKSIEQRKSKTDKGANNEYVFYDGPPFANGLPHYGHLLTGFVKDIFARYHTIKGERVERRFGWDCHGLPAEMGAERDLGISGRHAIMDYGIDKFNDYCRTSVMKYADSWEEYVDRQARWVDFKRDYKTMDTGYMESVLWAFKQLYDKGLVYESMRVMPYSWACETPLSNFETRMDNAYRERADKAVTVGFKVTGKLPTSLPKECKEYRILAWTTTPWTLPSNLALGINKEFNYSIVVKDVEGVGNVGYILASFAVAKYTKELGLGEDAPTPQEISGEQLLGLTYEPLLPYFKNEPNCFKVLQGDFITEGDGTGVVHLAPGFGEDDMAVCQVNNIVLVCPVDNSGKFTAQVPDFEGMQVFDANDEIIKRLKKDGSWLRTDQYLHSYPHCWRTDTPLIYKAVPSWYVKVTAFKDRMVELNQQINWIPDNIKDGQFGRWLENARDWSISRNRFWGSPIPVWRSDNPENQTIYVFGSIKELEEFFGTEVKDLHRPFIDQLTKPDPLNPKYTLRRVEDVFDCWFESGSMPYAQVHYPFENREWFENHFPADFIVEYVAQTRGWFYTLMVLSTALFDRPPFKNCICHGVVLDEKGQKLSKRLNNYADPMMLFDTYGADAMRWVMVSAPIMQGGELLIDKEGNMVRDAVRLVLKPIWKSYHFFTLYANADGIKANFSTDS